MTLNKKQTYFCKLCRNSGIELRKAHLRNLHGTRSVALEKRACYDLLEIIFVENAVVIK